MRRFCMLIYMVLLLSCKNDDNRKAEFPKELYLTRIKIGSGIHLYSDAKEIHDQRLINNFVKDQTYFRVKDSLISQSDRNLAFANSDTASISHLWKKLITNRNGNMFLFRSLGEYPVSINWINNVLPMSKYRMVPGNQWYDGDYRISIMLTGYGDYNQIEVPVFNYKIVKNDKYLEMTGLHRSESAGNTYNEFDDSYLKTVRASDTLAIEQYSLVFTRQD